MHVLFISLSDKYNEGARTIQSAKVINALQMNDVFVTVITIHNERLRSFDKKKGRIIFLSDEKRKGSNVLEKTKDKLNEFIWKVVPRLKPESKLGIETGLQIVRKENPDVIFSSSNPLDSHIVGAYLKERTGLPWIASFSDPRPAAIMPPPYKSKRNWISMFFEKRQVLKILKRCDYVHMFTEYGLQLMNDAYRVDIKKKGIIIPHIGETLKHIHPKENKGSNGNLIHVGRIKNRLSEELFLAIRYFYHQNPSIFRGITCVGKFSSEVKLLARELNMENIVHVINQVPHDEALRIISESSAVLIIEAKMEFSPFFPSKFSEATFLGKPILAITPEKSAMRNYLEKYGGGIAVKNNKKEIIKALNLIFKARENELNDMIVKQKDLSYHFSYKTIGMQYFELLLEAIAKHKHTKGLNRNS